MRQFLFGSKRRAWTVIGFAGCVVVLSAATFAVAQSSGGANSFWSHAALQIRAASENNKEPVRDGNAVDLELIVKQLQANAKLNEKLTEIIDRQAKQIRELAQKVDELNVERQPVQSWQKPPPHPMAKLLDHVPYYRQMLQVSDQEIDVCHEIGEVFITCPSYPDAVLVLRPRLIARAFCPVRFMVDKPQNLNDLLGDDFLYIWKWEEEYSVIGFES